MPGLPRGEAKCRENRLIFLNLFLKQKRKEKKPSVCGVTSLPKCNSQTPELGENSARTSHALASFIAFISRRQQTRGGRVLCNVKQRHQQGGCLQWERTGTGRVGGRRGTGGAMCPFSFLRLLSSSSQLRLHGQRQNRKRKLGGRVGRREGGGRNETALGFVSRRAVSSFS